MSVARGKVLVRCYLWRYAIEAIAALSEPCRASVMDAMSAAFVSLIRLLQLPAPWRLFSKPGSPFPSQFGESSNIILINLFCTYVSQGPLLFFVFKNLD